MDWQLTRYSVAATILVLGIYLSLSIPGHTVAQTRTETRCGWFSNPTPANAWLIDKDGVWTIGIQGGYQSEGDWPDTGKWVETNVHYGYGCTCMRGRFDHRTRKVIETLSSKGRPLSACRKDTKLRNKEPR